MKTGPDGYSDVFSSHFQHHPISLIFFNLSSLANDRQQANKCGFLSFFDKGLPSTALGILHVFPPEFGVLPELMDSQGCVAVVFCFC